jgi:hypothetical protein
LHALTMLAVLQHPYVFALALAFCTALLSYLYSRTLDKDPTQSTKTFFKTMAAGTLAGIVLTYVAAASRGETLATEPFDMAAPTSVPAAGLGGI